MLALPSFLAVGRFLALLAWVGLAWNAWAAHPDVEAAKTAYRNGDFHETLNHLELAEHSPSATDEDRVAVCWYRAACLTALGQPDNAANSLDALVELRPMYQPDRSETPPNLRALLKARQDAWHQLHGVTLGPPMLSGAEFHVDLAGHVETVSQLRVFARAHGGSDFQAFDLPLQEGVARGALNSVTLWEDASRAGGMDVVVEAYNQKGALLAREGDALQPAFLAIQEADANVVLAVLRKPAAVTPEAATPTKPAAPAPAPNRVLGVTPWMWMGAPSLTCGACCAASFTSSLALAVASIVALVNQRPPAPGTRPNGVDPFPCLGSLSCLACGTGCVTFITSSLLGTCTGALFMAERYYLGVLPGPAPAAPTPTPPAPVDDEEIAQAVSFPVSTQRY